MSFSLNEVDAMSKKAARGAGFSWGLAEEAGKAARWLCAQDLDGVRSILSCLRERPPAASCPLTRGTALSDRARMLLEKDQSFSDLRHPILLLPFAAAAARQINRTLTVQCDQATAITDGNILTLEGQFLPHARHVRISLAGAISNPMTLTTRAKPDPADWDALAKLAHLTYAPATDESRRLGAGSGDSDND